MKGTSRKIAKHILSQRGKSFNKQDLSSLSLSIAKSIQHHGSWTGFGYEVTETGEKKVLKNLVFKVYESKKIRVEPRVEDVYNFIDNPNFTGRISDCLSYIESNHDVLLGLNNTRKIAQNLSPDNNCDLEHIGTFLNIKKGHLCYIRRRGKDKDGLHTIYDVWVNNKEKHLLASIDLNGLEGPGEPYMKAVKFISTFVRPRSTKRSPGPNRYRCFFTVHGFIDAVTDGLCMNIYAPQKIIDIYKEMLAENEVPSVDETVEAPPVDETVEAPPVDEEEVMNFTELDEFRVRDKQFKATARLLEELHPSDQEMFDDLIQVLQNEFQRRRETAESIARK